MEWLVALVELYRRSAKQSVPTFAPHSGESQLKTAGHLLYIANKPAEALEIFNKEVNKPATEVSAGFAGTEEALIYGIEPAFVECFPVAASAADTTPFEQHFWVDRNAWWTRPSWSPDDNSPQFTAEIHLPEALRPSTTLANGSAL